MNFDFDRDFESHTSLEDDFVERIELCGYTCNIKGNFPPLFWLDKYLEYGGFIAGGCFKHILNGERVKDIDIFFENEKDFDNALTLYERDSSYTFVYKNKKCVSFTDGNVRIELICSIFGDVPTILDQFDFSIVKAAYYKFYNEDFDNERYFFIYQNSFFEHLHMKRLVLDKNIPFVVSTFSRVQRYAKYGYFLCRESRIKLLNAIKQTNEDFDDLDNVLYDSGWD